MPKRNISLNGLRVFESAARLLSFTQAAEEHHVTQAAVSQQIRGLENQLGVQLFKRGKRGLSLTSAGQELAISTRSALNSVYDTIDRITGTDAEGVLSISTLASFASRWMIPRLAEFQRQHTDIDLHIHTSDAAVDLFGSRVDAGIRFAAVDHPGLVTLPLMLDSACLVAAPSLAAQINNDPQAIYDHQLIVDGNPAQNHLHEVLPECTADYITNEFSLDQSRVHRLVFSQSDNVVLAALAGQGVAVSRLTMCADEIESGRLEILLGYCRPMHYGYSLVYPEYRSNDALLMTFREWLDKQCRQFCAVSEKISKSV